MSDRPLVSVIVGSVRASRIGPDIARWCADAGRAAVAARIEVLDLRDQSLPMDAEPGIPAGGGGYLTEGHRAWSAAVTRSDAFVFVTPQYNWGYPAALKNALDALCSEWGGKPAMIVSYGGHGGGQAAIQLRQVMTRLKLRLTETMPALVLPAGQVEANSGTIDAAAAFADDLPLIDRGYAELAMLFAVAGDVPSS